MKRVLAVMAGIAVLLIGLSMNYSSGGASAMTMSEGSGTNTCTNSYPAPYTGGAGVAKTFHESDGSTVTITDTGAVIKQGRCGTPYREGWINTSDICNTQTAQDLNGHLSSGSSNPTGSTGFNGCTGQTQSPPPKPSSVTIINNNSQSQSQSQSSGGSSTQASASTSNTGSSGSASSSSAHAQVLGAQTSTSSSSAARTLPNTGPGNVLGFAGLTTVFGTVGHFVYSRRRWSLPLKK